MNDEPEGIDDIDEKINDRLSNMTDEELIQYSRRLAAYLKAAGIEQADIPGLNMEIEEGTDRFEESVKAASLAEEKSRIANAHLEAQTDLLLTQLSGQADRQYYTGPRKKIVRNRGN